MLLTRSGFFASVTCLLVLTLIVSGCNQLATQSKGESVDLSVPETKSQTGTAAPDPTSANRGEKVGNLSQPQKITEEKIANLPQVKDSQAKDIAPKPTEKQNKPAVAQNKLISKELSKSSTVIASTTKPAENVQIAEEPSPSADLKIDATVKPEEVIPFNPGNGPSTLTFKDLYSKVTVRGVEISEKLKSLNNAKVEMSGYMAPPLSAKVNFFVLTKVALAICPFCSSNADWPIDIVVVFMPDGKFVTPTEHPIKVTGTLSVGSQTDNSTGFVSLIRIQVDEVEELK